MQDHSPTIVTHQEELDNLIGKVSRLANNFLGFQTSQHVRFDPALYPLLNLNLLNIGDAYTGGNFRVNAKEEEQKVLDFYARHWSAPNPDRANSAESYWGYMTTMGSTEGNLFGLWNARDYLHGEPCYFADADTASLVSKTKAPVLLTSRDSHYSIAKAAHILGIQLPSAIDCGDNQVAPDFIASDFNGAINVDQLVYWAELLFAKGHPLIFSLNSGTTFKGGFDAVQKIIARLPTIFKDTSARNYWIHIDAAICGNTLPWIEQAQINGAWQHDSKEGQFPHFDFRIPEVSSICASPYKWIGAPWPYGIYLARGKYRLQPPVHPKYIGSPDSTFSGSRSGLACVYSWHYFATKSQEEHWAEVNSIQTLVNYAYGELKKLEGRLRIDGKPFDVYEPNYLSPMICFTKPANSVIEEFSLTSEDGESGEIAHIIVLKQVTIALIDRFIDAMKAAHDYE